MHNRETVFRKNPLSIALHTAALLAVVGASTTQAANEVTEKAVLPTVKVEASGEEVITEGSRSIRNNAKVTIIE